MIQYAELFSGISVEIEGEYPFIHWAEVVELMLLVIAAV